MKAIVTGVGLGFPRAVRRRVRSSRRLEPGHLIIRLIRRPRALLDLRYLNEKEAGQSGFVRLTADGDGFVLGDGTPVRFWAVGTEVVPANRPPRTGPSRPVPRQARREHGPAPRPDRPEGAKDPQITEVDPKEIDDDLAAGRRDEEGGDLHHDLPLLGDRPRTSGVWGIEG